MNVRLAGPNPTTSEDVSSPMPGLSMEEFAALCSQIVIFTPHRTSEGVTGGLFQANGYWARWGMHTAPIEDTFGGEIAATRAGMCRAFLTICQNSDPARDEAGLPRLRYLVMIDNDEIVHPAAPPNLAFWDEPVVSGVVCSTSEYGGIKACFTAQDQFGNALFPTLKYTGKLPAKGLREIHSCGAGLLCIRRDVIEAVIGAGMVPFKIPESERDDAFKTGLLRVGEDISFCRQVKDLGFKVFVDFAVRAAHLKIVPIAWPDHAIDPSLDAREWMPDPRDYAHGF